MVGEVESFDEFDEILGEQYPEAIIPDKGKPDGHVKSSLLRVRNIVSDVFENFDGPTETHTRKWPRNPEILDEDFLPRSYREKILLMSNELEVGKVYRCKFAVGKKEEGTKHGHYFYLKKEESSVKIYFVDPEDKVGQRNVFRPSVTNLMAAEIFDDSNKQPKFAVLRFRYKNAKARVEFPYLVRASFNLIENEAIPSFLDENDDYQVTFRLVSERGLQVLESRHAHSGHLRNYLEKGRGCRHLEGKAHAQRAVLRNFMSSLERGDFREIRPAYYM
jgi:hypothetical protein